MSYSDEMVFNKLGWLEVHPSSSEIKKDWFPIGARIIHMRHGYGVVIHLPHIQHSLDNIAIRFDTAVDTWDGLSREYIADISLTRPVTYTTKNNNTIVLGD